MEHREDVLEYYDQPPPFKIQYTSASGRNLGVIITPDFFVIRSTSAGWVECKTEQELEKLAQKSPHRYQRDTNNKWQSPPGLEYAQQFGFDFLLWSSAKINWTLQRNLEFLEDYYKSDLSIKLDEHCNIVMSLVDAHPGISVAKLLDYKGVNADTIYSLLATEKIYVDLTVHLLVEADKCQVFKSRVVENALKTIICTENVDQMITPIVDLIPGTSVVYDGVNLNIILVGQDYLLLSAKEFETIELKISEFFALVNSGKIQISPLKNHLLMYEQAMEILKRASTEDLINANRRFNLLKPYLDGEAVGSISKERSLRRWLYNYRQAQQKYGYGYLGLISLNNRKGNHNRKLLPQVLEILSKFITEEYESKKQKTKQSVYASFIHTCLKSGIADDQIPSYKTFINEIKKRPKHSQVEKRSGNRAAYEMSEFYWELELSTPRHGDFPFHIAHFDHTELDIELRCSKTGKVLGRPWLTLLVDAFTRRILAIYVSYDPPSYRSCMMALRICVQRYSRLPQIIVTDNGKEFYSTYFETLLAIFECTLKRRPPAQPRFSSVCERLFGTTNTQFLYNLAGNTQITKKVRLMTKSVNPKNLSVWTLGLLYMYLTEWAYSIYDTTEHPALQGQSPQEVFTTGINQFGSRNGRLIPYDENFRILTLPTTKKGKALVQPGKGIKIDNKYYWHQIFRDPQVEKTLVNVRYDPFNAGVAYAYIQGLWVECISEYYSLFRGHSEKEIQLATAELKKQMQNHASSYKVRCKQLAEFIASTEAEEALLTQRLKDSQTLEVFQVMDGGLPNLTPYVNLSDIELSNLEIKQNDHPERQEKETINQEKLQIFNKY